MAKDMFADIASIGSKDARELYTPAPEKLPDLQLPAQKSDPKAAFTAPKTMHTQAQLDAELAKMRRKYAPFLAEYAPKVPERRSIGITKFDWRIEKGSERTSGLGEALRGEGKWQPVTLPHYGEPLGRACTSYRTTFTAKKPGKKESCWLCFTGVDYRCEAYVNGMYAGEHEGFFDAFDFEVGELLRNGENTLLVRVFNDAPATGVKEFGLDDYTGDKLYACTGLGWDDSKLGWHHCPPGMGIYGSVKIEYRPRIFLRDLFVRPLADLKHVEVVIELFNCGFLQLKKEEINFKLKVYGLNYRSELAEAKFTPEEKTEGKENRYRITLELPEARVWSPETPWMEELQVTLNDSDTIARRFGMRTFTQDTATKPYGRFFLNGKSIRLRGANTMGFEQQDVQRGDFKQLTDDILLAKIANLNFWRITQRPVAPEVYDYCDRLGLMVQCDFPLFGKLPARQFSEACRQAGIMEKLIRNHPSVIVVTMINEPFPADMVPFSRFCIRRELEDFFAASALRIRVENPDRVIKPVDGDYDPPAPNICDIHCYNLWYNGHMVDYGQFHRGYWTPSKPEWLLGCGEYGIEGLDPVDLMRRRYPAEWLPATKKEEKSWSPSQIVKAQTGNFYGMFYETPETLEGWVRASQEHQRRGVEAMTRSFRRDNRFVTMAVHLFIDAWPSGWMKSVMDCERKAKPAYFALRDTLAPLAADVRSDRYKFYSGDAMKFEFRVLNYSHEIPAGALLRWQLKIGGKTVFAQKIPAKIEEDRSTFQGYFTYPAPKVTKRTGARIEAVLEYDGKLHDAHGIDFQIFPAAKKASALRVIPVGDAAASLAAELECTVVEEKGNYLISNYQAYLARRKEIDAAVAAGAKAVFCDLPRASFTIGGEKIEIKECSMYPRHFGERVKGSKLVEGFEIGDFEYWYDADKDYIVPIAENCFRCDAFAPALWTISGSGEPNKWTHAMLVGNKGNWFVTTLKFNGLLKSNPTARAFAEKLLK